MSNVRVHIFSEPVSMSKSFGGLAELVGDCLSVSPRNGDYFLFHNRKQDYLKVLRYDGNGFEIYAKRLDEGFFMMPVGKTITEERLKTLLHGAIVYKLPDKKQEKFA